MVLWRNCIAFMHRRFPQIIKSIFLLFTLSFLWLQLRVANITTDFFVKHSPFASDNEVAIFLANFSTYSANSQVTKNITFQVSPYLLRRIVKQANEDQTIRNAEIFGPLETDEAVIIVQVHNRVQYLYALIESLRKTQRINHTLLVFSHDFYDPNINALVNEIDFCKVLQIFYPYSVQLYPHEYPGEDPNDCPRDIKKLLAVKRGCNNALYPDLYGHYREAKFSQTKHHWWWKINHIMDGVQATKKHKGPFLFLEEDHYVAPDVLHVLKLMLKKRKEDCAKCSILCMGTYMKSFNYITFGRHVEQVKWHSSKHNMGMVFERDLWFKIKNCTRAFCKFDDYNWDWSLQHISSTCLPSPLLAMVSVAPRVFHIGECGVHHKGKDCSSTQAVQKVLNVLKQSEQFLFPSKLILRQGHPRPMKPPKGNGGWGDKRDHDLCMRHAFPKFNAVPKLC